MADATRDAEPGTVKRAIRTVTPNRGMRPNAEMDTIGWGMFLGLVILLVPMLPFLVILWLVSKALEFGRRQRG